jgi:hypothetical protein
VTDGSHGEGVVARVVWATGELPWEVAIDDVSFIDETGAVTKEWTADELGWSESTPVATEWVAKAFGKRSLPKPR